ncbi:MAG: hypothetical protein KIT33_15380 [Candidatus Kapabacteria bacterium]|nr:hypothetical protein [Ignavibacteriota bacterium]MCW5886351.1 hypothetical protein [Candidatus Kapabacteria bacterium]
MAEITLDNLKFAFSKDPTEIIEYFKSLGVVLDDEWDDYYEQFQTKAFKVAGINNAQHLVDAKELIEEAITKGTDLKVFKETLKYGLDLRGWHADLVVTQNISNAYNAGRYYQQIDDPDDDFPYLRPVVMMDKKTTDICQWLGNQSIVLKVKDPKLNNMYSPRHFRCRVVYFAISEKQRQRLGLTVKNVEDIPEKYWNKKEFRNLPSDDFNPDLSNFPKELQEKLSWK